MITLTALAARIDRLESRNAITELATRYAVACDEQDLEALTALFTEDAVMDSAAGRMRASGRAGIRDLFTRTFATRGPSCHWTHDVIIHLDAADPDLATGVVYSHAETTPDGVPSVAAFRYADRYRREQGVWRFARREIAYLYYVPATDYPTALGSPLRVAAGDARVAADYPETLPSWQALRADPGGA